MIHIAPQSFTPDRRGFARDGRQLDGTVRGALDLQARWGTSAAVEFLQHRSVPAHVIARVLDPAAPRRQGDHSA